MKHVKKSAWAFEATAVVAVGGEFGKTLSVPVVGLSMDRPGYKPGYNARAALAHLERTNLPRRYAVTDMAYYPLSKAEHYQIPMRERGWKLVGEVLNRSEAKGVFARVSRRHAGGRHRVLSGNCEAQGLARPEGRVGQRQHHRGTVCAGYCTAQAAATRH
ncbi:hypothetical protein [Corynebacterium macclintockiae]|uniref:hypothetical protein n=1 Tax=Corynebacterium macclintockiae TaxID=2913501 RepID=UPI00254B173B|nr:hypothetical protein [Corynebacterium macclintockiae]MDK8889993.1 hypothetical protein [Corynebacterium macclintockiae]